MILLIELKPDLISLVGLAYPNIDVQVCAEADRLPLISYFSDFSEKILTVNHTRNLFSRSSRLGLVRDNDSEQVEFAD